MVSSDKVKDVHGWLANREAFEIRAIRLKVSPSGRLFGLEYEIPEEGLLVSDSRIVDGVDEGYFYLVAFAYGLRFPLSDFMVEVLRAYNIAPS